MAGRDDNVAWLNAAQLDDWIATVGLTMALGPALDAQLKRDSGLNLFEYHILVALADAPGGALPMTDLATYTKGSPSRLSHAVSRLESSGWVERRACAEVGRRTAAVLTDAGRRTLEEAAPGHVREVRRLVVDVLTPEQFAALGAAARAIVAVADPELRRLVEPRSRR
jgi:DNA-binding MarR family transcriptional regulator